MTFWIVAGLLTALLTGMVTGPLYRQNPFLAYLLTFLIPLCALGGYFLGGNPGLAN